MLHLLVGIDTEGDNQWDPEARAHPTYENIHALPKLHGLFRQHGVRPTYFVTYPVARDPDSARTLQALLRTGGCEIGAHHHAWETPPFDEGDLRRHPYALQLPLDQVERQIDTLTSAIETAVDRRPVSYRSGRFGFSAEHVSALERAGYLVESSVAPLFYEAHKGGPDFVQAPLAPYFLAYDDATRPGCSNVLEIPLSAALNRTAPAWLRHAYARAPRPYATKRLLRLLGIAHVAWLRPSYASYDDMVRLARRIRLAGVPVLNLIFHSSEAIVGGSPYNRDETELRRFVDRLARFLEFATRELGAVPMTFAEFREAFCAPGGRHVPAVDADRRADTAG